MNGAWYDHEMAENLDGDWLSWVDDTKVIFDIDTSSGTGTLTSYSWPKSKTEQVQITTNDSGRSEIVLIDHKRYSTEIIQKVNNSEIIVHFPDGRWGKFNEGFYIIWRSWKG